MEPYHGEKESISDQAGGEPEEESALQPERQGAEDQRDGGSREDQLGRGIARVVEEENR